MGLHDEAGTHRRGGTMCPTSVGNLPRSRGGGCQLLFLFAGDRKSTRLNSSHSQISYAVFCLKKNTTSALRLTWTSRPAGTCHAILLLELWRNQTAELTFHSLIFRAYDYAAISAAVLSPIWID